MPTSIRKIITALAKTPLLTDDIDADVIISTKDYCIEDEYTLADYCAIEIKLLLQCA